MVRRGDRCFNLHPLVGDLCGSRQNCGHLFGRIGVDVHWLYLFVEEERAVKL